MRLPSLLVLHFVLFISSTGARGQLPRPPVSPDSLEHLWVAPEAQGATFPSDLSQFLPPTLAGATPDPRPAWYGRASLPPQALQSIGPIEVEGADLREVLHALASRAGVPITTDERLNRPFTVRLPAGPLIDALTALLRQERLGAARTAAGVYVFPAGAATDSPGPLPGAPPTLHSRSPEGYGGDTGGAGADVPTASYFVTAAPAATVPDEAQERLGEPPAPAWETDTPSDVTSTLPETIPPGVVVRGEQVSVNVEDAPLGAVLRDLARQTGLTLIVPSGADAQVTARWSDVPLDAALRVLLTGTSLTYRREGTTLVVADRQTPGMLTTRLIPLHHVPAGGLVEYLPDTFRQYATHQLIQEQNALLVTGPADIVASTEAYLRELDRPARQILLEVLVVEFETSGLRQLGVSFLGGLLPEGIAMPDSAGLGWVSYLFGGGSDGRGGLDVIGDGSSANRFLNFWSDLLGIRSIGRLPTDFFFRIQALEHTGQAEIRSRPHIATLNGHTATISIGTSQYYILKSFVPYNTGSGLFSQGDAEHFEYVQADVRLEITPWVTEDGGVTASIRPSFTTPVGAFDPRIPPTLHNWSVDTSVRLADGETFMIGGLIQEQERVVENRIPFLGSLPLIGRLFRNSRREKRTGELVIFITPHILTDAKGTSTHGPDDELHRRLAPGGRAVAIPARSERVW